MGSQRHQIGEDGPNSNHTEQTEVIHTSIQQLKYKKKEKNLADFMCRHSEDESMPTVGQAQIVYLY